MALTMSDMLGARAFIDRGAGTVTLHLDDFIDAEGNPYFATYPDANVPENSAQGAQKFLAGFFAYLNYKCKQQPVEIPVNTGGVVVDQIDGSFVPDYSQGFVAQENILTEGVQFENRGGITQIRFDFNFSIYLNNTFVYNVNEVV